MFRAACQRDLEQINKIIADSNFVIDGPKLEMLIVAVDKNDKVIGFLSLVTVLECAFLFDSNLSLKDRISSLKEFAKVGANEAKNLGFDIVHAFVEEDKVAKLLQKHFEFQPTKSTVLYRKV